MANETTKTVKLLSEPASDGQRWEYQGVWRIQTVTVDDRSSEFYSAAQPETVRVRIRRDAHESQSYGAAYLFDRASRRWHEVSSMPGSALGVKTSLTKKPDSEDFADDERNLLNRVCLILGWPPIDQ